MFKIVGKSVVPLFVLNGHILVLMPPVQDAVYY